MIAVNHPEAKRKHKNENKHLSYFSHPGEDAVGVLAPLFFKKHVSINQAHLHKVLVSGLQGHSF